LTRLALRSATRSPLGSPFCAEDEFNIPNQMEREQRLRQIAGQAVIEIWQAVIEIWGESDRS
jgi:hypothetical protein